MYGSTLPRTAAGFAVGGIFISQLGLLGIALVAVVVGALLVRYGFRRGKRFTQV